MQWKYSTALPLMQGIHSLANFFWLLPLFYNVCRFTMTQEAVSLDGMPLSHPRLIFSLLWSKNCPNTHALLLWQPQEVWEFLAWPSHLPLLFEEQGRCNILSLCLWLKDPMHYECWRPFHLMWAEEIYPGKLQAFFKIISSPRLFNPYHIIPSSGNWSGVQNQYLISLLKEIV